MNERLAPRWPELKQIRELEAERDATRAAVERVAKVLDHMVRQMHALDLGDDETQSKLDGWAAGIGGAAIVLRDALWQATR